LKILNIFKAVFLFFFENEINFYKRLWQATFGSKTDTQTEAMPEVKIEPVKAKPTIKKDYTISIDKVFMFATDAASFALFDPDVLAHRLQDEVDWLAESPFHEMPEVKAGDIGLMGLGADGIYGVKLFINELPEELQQYQSKKLTLGVKIISGKCFVGKAECLPAADQNITVDSIEELDGGFYTLDNGLYDVDVHYVDEDDVTLAIVFKTRTHDFIAPKTEPHLDDIL